MKEMYCKWPTKANVDHEFSSLFDAKSPEVNVYTA